MAFSKDLGLEWGGLGVSGSPSSLKQPPPSTIHRFFLYIMYKVEGVRAMAMEGAMGRGKPLLNRHLYIYINNFSVHRTVGRMGGSGEGWGERGVEL